jgi:hypothetical protein
MKINFIQQAQGDTVVSGGLYIKYIFEWWHILVVIFLIAFLIIFLKNKSKKQVKL